MDVSGTTTAAVNTTQRNEAPGASTAISSDFETFLKMLTTQLQNQDPMNPMNSSEFAVQLATFSGVEQQVRTNELLSGLSTQLTGAGLAQYAGWVGMEARVQAPAVYTGQPVTITQHPEPGADRAHLVVRDSQGHEVQRLDTSTAEESVVWSGLDADGIPLPDGQYSLAVESFSDGESLGVTAAEVYATVAEARMTDGEAMLVLESGSEVAAGTVTALRAGPSG